MCERVPIATKLEEKHTTILCSSYVDKSTVKVEGAVNISETGVAQERSEDEVQTPNRVAVIPPLVSSHDQTETFDELDSWRNEGSPDRFSDAVEEERYVEDRSILVTGHVLPLACTNQESSQQVHNESLLIFPPQCPHSSEREPRNESIPLPFWWPVEQ